MRVLLEEARAETVVRGSRFIAEALIIRSQAEARERLHAQKARYADATHVCHAFVAGPQGEANGMSDDGEPGGTAGRPMLDVLRGSGITNILVTVTRYFGGTLLGTGGLVRAYGDAVKAVLAACRTEELVEKRRFSLAAGYGDYEGIRRVLAGFHISALGEEFGEAVALEGEVWGCEAAALAEQVRDLTRGRIAVRLEQ